MNAEEDKQNENSQSGDSQICQHEEIIENGSGSSMKMIVLFVCNCGLMILFFMMQVVYTGGVIRTIERRFGLSSQQTGILSSINDTAHIFVVIFIGHLARSYNKPRLLAFTILFSAVGGFMMALPYFIAPSKQLVPPTNHSHNESSDDDGLCGAQGGLNLTEPVQNTLTEEGDKVAKFAFTIFILAHCVSGIGSSGVYTLSLAYVDENSPKSKSSVFLGFLMSLFSFGPLCGFMLAAVTLRLPEKLTGSLLDERDDHAIGNWWLGYVICSTALILLALPMFFFPTRISPTAGSTSQSSADDQSPVQRMKDFPKEFCHLMRNKLYVVSLLVAVCGSYVVMGIFVNMVRYIETHFMQEAFIASTITAFVLAFCGGLGAMLGGVVMSRFELTPLGALRLMMLSSLCMVGGFIIVVFLHCPQPPVNGHIDELSGLINVSTTCSYHCGCSETGGSGFDPVCGSDGLTYFSPCYAGCHVFKNQTYSNCVCVTGGGPLSTLASDEILSSQTYTYSGWARRGFCHTDCGLLVPFGIIISLVSFIGAVARVPATIVTFRIVDDEERSLALSINSFVVNVLGFIPAPILFGMLIDSSCLLWDTSHGPDSGACLLYNTATFRNSTYGVAAGVQALEFTLSLLLYILLLRSKSSEDSKTSSENLSSIQSASK